MFTIESKITAQLNNLNVDNQANCLELIMSLEPEYRMPFLNHFVVAVAAIEDSCVEWALAA